MTILGFVKSIMYTVYNTHTIMFHVVLYIYITNIPVTEVPTTSRAGSSSGRSLY